MLWQFHCNLRFFGMCITKNLCLIYIRFALIPIIIKLIGINLKKNYLAFMYNYFFDLI